MKSISVAVVLAFLCALLITGLSKPRPLEAQLMHLQLEQAAPSMANALSGESAELQALFLDYADDEVLMAKAGLAMLRYPHMARPILLAYGDQPEFTDVLRRYGEDIVLPIHYFLSNEVFTLELMHGLGETTRSALSAVRRWWGAESTPADSQAVLSGEQRGEFAIRFLQAEGYDFLGQFVMSADGQVRWLQTERVLEGINSFFAGGLKGLETKLRRDETIAVGDVGWAALDVAIGVSAFKILRMGRASVAGGRSLTFSQRSAALGAGLWRGTTVGARLVKYGAPVVLAYVAIRHPSVINSLLASAAEKLGVPVAAAQVVGWTLLLLPVMLLLRLFLRPLAWLLAGTATALRWSDAGIRGSGLRHR